MAATLQKNGSDGKPITHPGLPPNEIVECSIRGCPISYTLAYGKVEVHRLDSAIHLMRRNAAELILNSHPHPLGRQECYWWSEPERGWLDEGVR